VSDPDWNTLYRDLLPKVYNFFRYRVTDSMLAEDLTSITFKQAWQSRARYRDHRASFSTWLFTIARRVAADHFREHYARAEMDLDDAEQTSPDEDSPEQLAEDREEVERIRHLIQRLPEREQELIALKYGAGLSYQRIAELTGLSISNVGVILHRAIQRLREQLEANHEPSR
jgi:RNA polymerase sigma-70 factor (ECF subfamily)